MEQQPLSTTATLAAAVFCCACGQEPLAEEEDLGPRGDCNPVGEEHCTVPFPSSFFLEEDPTTGTGFRVAFGPESLPVNSRGVRTDPTDWNKKDGFSTLGGLLMHLPGATVQGVVGHRDLGAYLDEDVKTVILDLETGARIPHFVEEFTRGHDPDRQLMVLHPVEPMAHGRRHAVGVRGLVDASGDLLPADEGFRVLRDGLDSDDADLLRQQAAYEEHVFPALEADGFARQDLQLAWDFVTVSEEASLGPALAMRNDALARVPSGGPPYVVESVTEAGCPGSSIGRTVKGTMTVPLYLTSWEPGSRFHLEEDGMPAVNGEAEVPFTIRIPCTLIEDPRPGRLLQYGHGVLGSQSEVESGVLGSMANQWGWILFAVDWTGMKGEDTTAILHLLSSGLSDFASVPERTLQGFIEQSLAARMMTGDMAEDPNLAEDGVSLVDTSEVWFYGNSQGAILGGGYVAMSTDIHRAVLGVGGTPLSLIVPRSMPFEPYLGLLNAQYEDALDVPLLIALMQMLWDPGETAGWAWFMNRRTLDGDTPPKDVLIHAAIGDASVPTLSAHVAARAFGAALVDPPAREIWGLEMRAAPFEGSAIVEFDYGVEEPVGCEPCPSETTTHDEPRKDEAGQAQIRAFLEDRLVIHTSELP